MLETISEQRCHGCTSLYDRSACLRQPRQQNGGKRVGWTIGPTSTGISRSKFPQANHHTAEVTCIPRQRLQRPQYAAHVGAAHEPVALLGKYFIERARFAVERLLDGVEELSRGSLRQQGKQIIQARPA